MARFPFTLDNDTTEVRDALEIARTQYTRGDLHDAMRWLRRAADIAYEQRAPERAVSLSKAADDLGPPRPGAAPQRATESVRPRAPEAFPMNPSQPPRAAERTPRAPASTVVESPSRQAPQPAPQPAPRLGPARPVTAPASTAPALAAARALERPSSPSNSAIASSPPVGASRPIVASRPVPIPRNEEEPPTDAFRLPDHGSAAEPILLTARKVEPYVLDDDSTHVGAAPAGFLAAIAAVDAQSKTTPEKPAPAPSAVKPGAQPAARAPAPQPAQRPTATAPKPSPQQPAPKPSAPAASTSSAARVSPQRPSAKPAPAPAAKNPEAPSQKAPAPRVEPAPAVTRPVAGSVAIADDEDEDRTSPGILPQAIQAMVAAVHDKAPAKTPTAPRPAVAQPAVAPKPATHQALRVALSKGASGVSARAVGADGLRAGEVEVMVVGLAADADLAALFA
jgi:hypothetical protein